MATLYGIEATKVHSSEPSEMVDVGSHGGAVKQIYDKYTAAGAIALNDVIYINGLLPRGARIIDALIKSDDLGTVGTLDLGWAAGSNGDEIADPNGLINAMDVNAAANTVWASDNLPNAAGIGKKFEEAVQLMVTASAATDAAGSFEVIVLYAID